MYILGLNIYHGDSAACLFKDGKLLYAIEEERIRRIKHWAGFPSESIKACFSYAGVDIKDIDYISVSRNPYARLHKKLWRVFTRVPRRGFVKARLDNYKKIGSIKESLADIFGCSQDVIKARLINVEHHLSHISSGFFVSPFESAAVVSVDGFGDFSSVMLGRGDGNKLKIFKTADFPHSLGIFYTALTQFLGFNNYGDEYKIMGLSALGEPVFLDKMRKIVRLKNDGLFELNTDFFLHDKDGVEMTWLDGAPLIGGVFSKKLEDLLGKVREKNEQIDQRHKDIAASVQAIYEEAFFHILNNLHKLAETDNIVLAGGCIQNSLANGKITSNTPFKNIYIPPAAYDAGTAIGSAVYVWNKRLNNPRSFVMDSPYWGDDYNEDYIKRLLGKQGVVFELLDEEELIKRTAMDIADEKVVGWFCGRTEWGPRALGARSILADPRSANMQDILNSRIKKREVFRPFAPSILEEEVDNWFEKSDGVPFMEKVYKIKEEKRVLLPAVCHKDGTGRLQTVSSNINTRYYNLIKEFDSITGVPMILNTSFNENEPIVNSPEEALDCFLRTKMDVLVIEKFYIKR
ncbi:MAG: carbamoyltransferase C-terminal domain-containing protein [Candidatus Omnitrophota bacterium]